jgi:membrane associated rhomboid family serine protease
MTIIIVAITVLVSIVAFNDSNLFSKLLFDAWKVTHRKEWYRMFSHGLLHADWMHLAVNMFVLFSFGKGVEYYFGQLEAEGMLQHSQLWFLFLYISSLCVASLPTLRKHRNDLSYTAVGASGAVSAVMTTCIFFNPWSKLYFWAMIPIPGIVFAAAYIFYSSYMSKKPNGEPINHDAHLYGMLYGFVFPLFINPKLFMYFVSQLVDVKF